ncbi:SDR family oxidoreductase [Pseudomonas sp. SK2]|uniref:UDP-glucose 4-epimerase family protein n=1 Tax=Pseudomonas sp. SK2 TaxID=2841063 RepID=UPI00192B860B|nr:SDR family oxidoreductase [Pseudomonas sp. SK2]QQZ37598.1 SDR family oxidoreductase [Pseudomonas sp. SK2]
MKRRVLVTGATGFVGGHVMRRLLQEPDVEVIAGVRKANVALPPYVKTLVMGDLAEVEDQPSLEGIQTVIHCAARVHIMNDPSAHPLREFRKANVQGTLQLAQKAVDAGVKRFVFLSSIKVNGEGTDGRAPYSADEIPTPVDAYGLSKLEAEQALLTLAFETGMEVSIIRPVLVYGPGVRANFLSMMRWLLKGVPLPLGAIHNKRSLVALDNLVDLIRVCTDHPRAVNQVFLVSDGNDLSTPQLMRKMAIALGCNAMLVPIPTLILRAGAKLLGRAAVADRLCGSLQVDITKTQELLDWKPPVTVEQALLQTANHYLELLKA